MVKPLPTSVVCCHPVATSTIVTDLSMVTQIINAYYQNISYTELYAHVTH